MKKLSLFKRFRVDGRGGVILRLFRMEKSTDSEEGEEKKEPDKVEYICETCGFKAKNNNGLRLHKLKKHKING